MKEPGPTTHINPSKSEMRRIVGLVLPGSESPAWLLERKLRARKEGR